MPVGTQGSVKTLTPARSRRPARGIVLGNTYHLWLRPGPGAGRAARRAARVHAVAARDAHRLGRLPGVLARGAAHGERGRLRVPLAPRRREACALSPEVAMQVQGALGADIAMQLDVCPPGDSPRPDDRGGVRASPPRWARRCLAAKAPRSRRCSASCRAARFADLRRAHAEELGRDAVRRARPRRLLRAASRSRRCTEALDEVAPMPRSGTAALPDGRRHAARTSVRAIGAGVDMFDCVLPTRNARNGQALTPRGGIVIKQARFKDDPRPIDPDCAVPAVRRRVLARLPAALVPRGRDPGAAAPLGAQPHAVRTRWCAARARRSRPVHYEAFARELARRSRRPELPRRASRSVPLP